MGDGGGDRGGSSLGLLGGFEWFEGFGRRMAAVRLWLGGLIGGVEWFLVVRPTGGRRPAGWLGARAQRGGSLDLEVNLRCTEG